MCIYTSIAKHETDSSSHVRACVCVCVCVCVFGELLVGAVGSRYDGLVAIAGCDKNMPGVVIAMARMNRPSIMVYGGTIKPGCSASGEKLDIVSAFQSYGQFVSGSITEEERREIVRKACPGPGACGGECLLSGRIFHPGKSS